MSLRRILASAGVIAAATLGLTGCTSDFLANSCRDYQEWDQNHAQAVSRAASAVYPSATEEEKATARADVEEARAGLQEIMDNTKHEEFYAVLTPQRDNIDQLLELLDPNISVDEMVAKASEMDTTELADAVSRLNEMCSEAAANG